MTKTSTGATGALNTTLDATRAILRIEGADAESFLQGLLSNDVKRASASRGVYAALLTPQGKLIADMILWRPAPDLYLADVAEGFAGDLEKRLTLYKLRSSVAIARASDLSVRVIWSAEGAPVEAPPADGVASGPDPRDPGLGWRVIAEGPGAPGGAEESTLEEWNQLRIARGVPASGLDLRAGDAYPLEYGFERLNGVDFKKGCFVGQEIVARMKHKAELKKGLFRVEYEGPAPEPGADVLSEGRPSGSIGSAQAGTGLALLRLDRAESELTVGEARIVKVARV